MILERVIDPRVFYSSVALIGVALTGLTWTLQYLPTAQKSRQLRNQIDQLSRQVHQTESFLQEAGGAAAWMEEQNQILQQLAERFPSSEQIPRLLDVLVKQVGHSNLRLVNVAQGNLESAKDGEGQTVKFNGSVCLRLPLVLNVEGRFRDVLDYLEAVTGKTFPCLVRVEGMDLEAKHGSIALLNVTLKVVLYVHGS